MEKLLLLSKIEIKKSVDSNRLWLLLSLVVLFIVILWLKAYKYDSRITFDTMCVGVLLLNGVNLLILGANMIWDDYKNGMIVLLHTANVKKDYYLLGKILYMTVVNVLFIVLFVILTFLLNIPHFMYFLPNILYLFLSVIFFSLLISVFLLLLSYFVPLYSNSILYVLLSFLFILLPSFIGESFVKIFENISLLLLNIFLVSTKIHKSVLDLSFDINMFVYIFTLFAGYYFLLSYIYKNRGIK
jgi:ABC-type transport system involved in multi-copper enzyme maturation permease subunit